MRSRRTALVLVGALLLLLPVVAPPVSAGPVAVPTVGRLPYQSGLLLPSPLPVALWGQFLTGLTVPTLAPASSGVVSFSVGDPMGVALSSVVLTLGVYAFNAYPGNATGPVPAPPPQFSGSGFASGTTVVIAVGTLMPGGPAFTSPGSSAVSVVAPAGASEGTYAIRTSLEFTAGGESYVLESRGHFSTAEWENATSAPGLPSSLNATRLGVSGVIPETGLLVRSNPFPVALAVVLGGSLVLAGVGGYWAVRRGPRSRSGAKAGPAPSQADTAFGNKRSNDGD